MKETNAEGLITGLDAVLRGLVKHDEGELQRMTSGDLEQFWFFKWNEKSSVEWNIYQFTDLLELYRRQCRRWEEKHNGSVCVVERVRDKYLMPKITEFARHVAGCHPQVQPEQTDPLHPLVGRRD